MKSCQNILRQGQLPTGIPFPSLSDSIADEMMALRHHHPRTWLDDHDRGRRSRGEPERPPGNGRPDPEAEERLHQTRDPTRRRPRPRLFFRRERCAWRATCSQCRRSSRSCCSADDRVQKKKKTPSPQIFKQMSNHRGTRLYKAQKKFQSVFGFTLRESYPRFLCVLDSVANDGNLAFSSFPQPSFSVEGSSTVGCTCITLPRPLLTRRHRKFRQHGTHAISPSDRLSRSVAFFRSFPPIRTTTTSTSPTSSQSDGQSRSSRKITPPTPSSTRCRRATSPN